MAAYLLVWRQPAGFCHHACVHFPLALQGVMEATNALFCATEVADFRVALSVCQQCCDQCRSTCRQVHYLGIPGLEARWRVCILLSGGQRAEQSSLHGPDSDTASQGTAVAEEW